MAQTDDLLGFVSSLQGGDGLRVEETLGDGYVRLRISEAERRQAKHDIRCVEDAVIELLRNARDAGATHIFLGTVREGNTRILTIVDDGSGIPAAMHRRVFDARVTSKLDTMRMDRWGVHGRGMALYSIRENALAAEVVSSDVGIGCAMRILFDVASLPERADQSSWPEVTGSSDFVVRGPRNIYRTCVEFAMEERGVCNVYVGSPSEILSSMRVRCEASAESVAEANAPVPLVERPSMAHDARELAGVAGSLGIDISERNAHRIIKGQIPPLVNAVARTLGTRERPSRVRLDTRGRRLVLSDEDQVRLRKDLSDAFDTVAQRYYVRLSGSPSIRMGEGRMTVTYDFVEDD